MTVDTVTGYTFGAVILLAPTVYSPAPKMICFLPLGCAPSSHTLSVFIFLP